MAQFFWVGGTGSWTAVATTHWSTTSGGGAGAGPPGAGDDAIFGGNSGGGTVTLTANVSVTNLLFAGATGTSSFTGTFAGTNTINVAGGLTWGGSMTRSHTGAITFSATTTGFLVTSNGIHFGEAVTFNGVGGGWTLADAFFSTTNVTVTNGSFSTGNKSFKLNELLTAVGTKTIALGSSAIELTSTGTVWSVSATNLTLTTAGSKITISDASGSAKAFGGGTSITYDDIEFTGGGTLAINNSGMVFRDVTVSSATATSFAITAASTFRNLSFAGFTGTWAATQSTITLAGNVTLSAGMTNSNTSTISITGSCTVTSNTNLFACAINYDSAGNSLTLADAFRIVNGTATTFTLVHGTIDCNGKDFKAPRVNLGGVGAGTRALIMGGIFECSGDGTVFQLGNTPASLTITAGTSEIRVTDAGANQKALTLQQTNSFSYNKITLTGAGSGAFLLSALTSSETCTIAELKIDTPPHTVKLQGNSVTAIFVITKLTAVGTAGNLIDIQSSTGGTKVKLTKPGNDIDGCDYLRLTDVSVAGGARWFAGRHSVDGGNNYGWRYTDKYRSPVLAVAP